MAETKFRVGVEQAARVAGVSRWTIHRRVKAGKLSCTRDKQGHPLIDLAELARVFELEPAEVAAAVAEQRGARRSRATALQSKQRGATLQPGADRAAGGAVERLEADLRRERERIERLEAELRSSRDDVREWQAAYRALAERVLLTDQRPAPTPEPQRTPVDDAPPPPPPAADRRDADTFVDRIEAAAAALGVLPDFLRIRRR